MIVVTTPTGDIGKQVLDDLLDDHNVASGRIRVIVRDPARLSEAARERVDVIEGSHGETAVVDRAFDGAQAVFWLVPPNPKAVSLDTAYAGFTRPACDAIRRHGVKRVVSVSALGRGTPWADHAGLVTASLAMDDLLAGTGVALRALTMPSFMDNLLRQVESIKTRGVYSMPGDPDRRMPTCATRDIAASATRLLADASWTGQGPVAVLGPEDLSYNDMARTLSDVLGKPVRCESVPFDAFEARLKQGGMSAAFVRGYVDMMRAKDAGLDNAEPRTPENTTPTTFNQWCRTVLRAAVTTESHA